MTYPRENHDRDRTRRLILALVALWDAVKDFIKRKPKGRLP